MLQIEGLVHDLEGFNPAKCAPCLASGFLVAFLELLKACCKSPRMDKRRYLEYFSVVHQLRLLKVGL